MKFFYLTVLLVVTLCSAQTELDINKTRTYTTVYYPAEIPELATEGEVLSQHHLDSTVIIRTQWPFDPNVLGVAVEDSAGALRIAVGGEVQVLVDDFVESIPAGEWIVSSGSPGRAMPIDHNYPLKAVVLGITLEAWTSGESPPTVKILLMPGERVSPRRHLLMPQPE